MNKRDIVIGMLNKSKATSICPRIMRFTKRNLTILAYHRVSDYKQNCPLDDNLISASPEEFEKQVRYLKANYDCIDFATLSDILKGNLRFRGNALIITFDDGYKDNYDNAYPILKEHGTPATIFIATEFIDKQNLFWWDKVAYMVKQFQGYSFNINGQKFDLKSSYRFDTLYAGRKKKCEGGGLGEGNVRKSPLQHKKERSETVEGPSSSKLTITYTGDVYPGTADALFTALSQIIAEKPELEHKLELTFVGKLEQRELKLLEQLKLENVVRGRGNQ